jgi:hypothetical protein
MKTFEMLTGYEAEYETMLKTELDRLISKKKGTGITFKEDNMIYQLSIHLGITVDLLSQRETKTAAVKDIGIESYN